MEDNRGIIGRGGVVVVAANANDLCLLRRVVSLLLVAVDASPSGLVALWLSFSCCGCCCSPVASTSCNTSPCSDVILVPLLAADGEEATAASSLPWVLRRLGLPLGVVATPFTVATTASAPSPPIPSVIGADGRASGEGDAFKSSMMRS